MQIWRISFLLLGWCFVAPVLGENLLYLNSDEGDPIGNGLRASYSRFSPLANSYTYPNGKTSIRIALQVQGLYMELASADGEMLKPGSFGPTTSNSLVSGRDFLSVSAFGGACSGDAVGLFTVHEIEVDLTGQVNVLSVDFSQYCNGAFSRLVGGLRIGSNIPINEEQLMSNLRLPSSTIMIVNEIDIADDVDAVYGYSSNDVAAVQIDGSGHRINISAGTQGTEHEWYVSLAAPGGQRLSEGVYTGATNEWRFMSDVPNLEVWPKEYFHHCSDQTGAFRINNLIRTDGSAIDRISLDFWVRCNVRQPWARGRIRFRTGETFSAIDGIQYDQRFGGVVQIPIVRINRSYGRGVLYGSATMLPIRPGNSLRLLGLSIGGQEVDEFGIYPTYYEGRRVIQFPVIHFSNAVMDDLHISANFEGSESKPDVGSLFAFDRARDLGH